VVKIFVLAQMRSISTGLERITAKLLRTVYEQELKLVHPMLDALRRDDPELIVKYSDLQLPEMDKRLLELRRLIEERQDEKESESFFGGNEKALRLHTMLQAMGCTSELLQPLIVNAFKEHPNLSLPELSRIILEWYSKPSEPKKIKAEKVNPRDWHTLSSEDLRFKFSQADKGRLYDDLKYDKELFDVPNWLRHVG
jgi:hypothetical protein